MTLQVTATCTTVHTLDLTGDDHTVAIRDFLASVPDGTPGALVVTNNNFGGGCFVEATNSAPVTGSGNTFGAPCP